MLQRSVDGDDDVVKVSWRRYGDIWGFGPSDFRLKPAARAHVVKRSVGDLAMGPKRPTFD